MITRSFQSTVLNKKTGILLQFIHPFKVSPTGMMEWGFLTVYHKFNVQSRRETGEMNTEISHDKLKPMASKQGVRWVDFKEPPKEHAF